MFQKKLICKIFIRMNSEKCIDLLHDIYLKNIVIEKFLL